MSYKYDPYNHKCSLCDEGDIPREEVRNGNAFRTQWNLCKKCIEIRETNAILFDLVFRLMENKIDLAISRHEDGYTHESSERCYW
jgi:hypothetical protein